MTESEKRPDSGREHAPAQHARGRQRDGSAFFPTEGQAARIEVAPLGISIPTVEVYAGL